MKLSSSFSLPFLPSPSVKEHENTGSFSRELRAATCELENETRHAASTRLSTS